MSITIKAPSRRIIHPCEMLPGQVGIVLNAKRCEAQVSDPTNEGHIIMCCEWGNGDHTIVDLTRPKGSWDEAHNDKMTVELFSMGTQINMTVEV